MAIHKLGKQTLWFPQTPIILAGGTVVGTKEGQGPLGNTFDMVLDDDMYGEDTWEKAESKILKESIEISLQKGGTKEEEVDAILAGDLLNQLMSAVFSARNFSIPFLGMYGACSTMTESMIMSTVLVDGGYADRVVAAASSHYSTAERQFRMPLEHGNQRPPSAQWTVTGAGSVVIGLTGQSQVRCTHATIGKIIDPGITDPHQMGAAMAPAALDTILTHLSDLGRTPKDYDRILTGDLGRIGSSILVDLAHKQGVSLEGIHDDCGVLIFREDQDVHSGGSGCGCSASVFAGPILSDLMQGRVNRVLLISTGALLTTISSQQGESIPGIAHAIAIEAQAK